MVNERNFLDKTQKITIASISLARNKPRWTQVKTFGLESTVCKTKHFFQKVFLHINVYLPSYTGAVSRMNRTIFLYKQPAIISGLIVYLGFFPLCRFHAELDEMASTKNRFICLKTLHVSIPV